MFYEKRVCVLYCAVVAAAAILIARLYSLSAAGKNLSMSVLDGQYTGRIEVCERSGFVYDRNGYLLSHNRAGMVALVNPAECHDALDVSDKLSRISLVSSASDIYEKILDGVPFTLMLSDKGEAFESDGVYAFDLYETRNDIAKHFFGYTSAGKGVSGIRKEYDEYLGKQLKSTVYAVFDTNAKRASLSSIQLSCEKYLSSDGLVTTIDKELQEFCDGLEDKIVSGAVVVSDVETGHILALSSFPGYDVSQLENVLFSDKGELVNRVKESFTPGSVFKMIVAAAALENDVSLWNFAFECTGECVIDDNVFKCHKAEGHGVVTMKEAFSQSCNTYFINLGRKIGLGCILQTMKKLELDKPTRADFLSESKSYFADEDNKTRGYLANISFGQGDLCLSPLDMTRTVNALSTGYFCDLSLIRGRIENEEFVGEKEVKRRRIFSENTIEKMLLMMKECVESGTGKAAKTQKVNSGGKTATAQTGRFSPDGVEYVHKWFCGVAPIENPKFSILVLCDFSTDSALSPAVVFGEICEYLSENCF